MKAAADLMDGGCVVFWGAGSGASRMSHPTECNDSVSFVILSDRRESKDPLSRINEWERILRLRRLTAASLRMTYGFVIPFVRETVTGLKALSMTD